MKTISIILIYFLFAQVKLTYATDVIEVDSDFVNDKTFIKITDKERGQYVLKVNNFGEITDSHGNVIDTRGVANGTALFVFQKDVIYLVVYRNYQKFNEITLAHKRPVTCAGQIKITRGVPEFITDVSAIYPNKSKNKALLIQVVDKMKRMGVDVSKIRKLYDGDL